jgi:K+-sensing histidine kinase KdpD
VLTIIDDGPGLSAESMITFGKRREQRQRREKNGHHFSLGLGSVIMKTIAHVHGGDIHMTNTPQGGACLKVVFKSA